MRAHLAEGLAGAKAKWGAMHWPLRTLHRKIGIGAAGDEAEGLGRSPLTSAPLYWPPSVSCSSAKWAYSSSPDGETDGLCVAELAPHEHGLGQRPERLAGELGTHDGGEKGQQVGRDWKPERRGARRQRVGATKD